MGSLEATIGVASPNTCQWGGKETILLVEDEAFVRKAAGEALESAGYRVVVAGSATQAFEVHRKCSLVDLLLADVILPGMSGHELAREFIVLRPQIRILLMSGYSEQLTARELPSYHEQYMAKPFSIPILLRRVREVLDGNPFDFGASA